MDGVGGERDSVTEQEINNLAAAWVEYGLLRNDSVKREEFDWAPSRVIDMAFDDGESLWKLILAIHSLDQSRLIQPVFAAGPLEDLLAHHGDRFIDMVESEARRDPSFAKVLGGVWKNQMSDEVWERVQAVWDRRGWDDVPE